MRSERWCYFGLLCVSFIAGGCANLNSATGAKQTAIVSEALVDQNGREYGFEKYLTESERAEWKQMLLSAIKEDCKPPYGTLAAETGWQTNRIDLSSSLYFDLAEDEKTKVIGVISLKAMASDPRNTASYKMLSLVDSSLSSDPYYNTAFDDLAYSDITYIFLPDYMYFYRSPSSVQKIQYSALLDAVPGDAASTDTLGRYSLVWGEPGDSDDIRITAHPISKLPKIANIYAVNSKFLGVRNSRIRAAAEQAMKEAERAAEKEKAEKLAELEKQAKIILIKNEQAIQKNISLKGIYIGMPIDEARTLLCYGMRTPEQDVERIWSYRVLLGEENGQLTSFSMDGGITMLFFGSLSITGEELAQQIADKYKITLEVDAYGKAWQYRDTKRGMKIQIGGDGSVKMEKTKSLLE